MRLHVERVSREDIVIAALEKDVIDFLNELRDTVHRLKAKYEPDNADAPEVVRLMAAG